MMYTHTFNWRLSFGIVIQIGRIYGPLYKWVEIDVVLPSDCLEAIIFTIMQLGSLQGYRSVLVLLV